MTNNANLTRLSDVKALLKSRGIYPNRVMGQNFLVDLNVLNLVVKTADLESRDSVLEVGGGLGVLTERLAEGAGRVVSVEKDNKLYKVLRDRMRDHPEVTLIHADMTDLAFADLAGVEINKMVSNLPYCVGNRVLVDLLQWDRPPELMVATVQLDVARRLSAGPGERGFGMLALWCGLEYDVDIVKSISPTCFFPSPRIRSAIVRMRRHRDVAGPEKRLFFALTKHAFGQRRKQVGNVFRKVEGVLDGLSDAIAGAISTTGIDPASRPDRIAMEQWLACAGVLASNGNIRGDT